MFKLFAICAWKPFYLLNPESDKGKKKAAILPKVINSAPW